MQNVHRLVKVELRSRVVYEKRTADLPLLHRMRARDRMVRPLRTRTFLPQIFAEPVLPDWVQAPPDRYAESVKGSSGKYRRSRKVTQTRKFCLLPTC